MKTGQRCCMIIIMLFTLTQGKSFAISTCSLPDMLSAQTKRTLFILPEPGEGSMMNDTAIKTAVSNHRTITVQPGSTHSANSAMTGFTCGQTVTVSHVAGSVAPVTKTVTYSTVGNIPGDTSKCWITRNLGASQQASALDDAAEASAGWYWKFNRKQGYKNDGSTVTPAWTNTPINENSDWIAANDPCTIELGISWRIPTGSEWTSVDNSGGWSNGTYPFASPLKMHYAGLLNVADGSLYLRGSYGVYSSSSQASFTNVNDLHFNSTICVVTNVHAKNYGYTLRCLRSWQPVVTTTAVSSVTASSVVTGGNVTDDGGEAVTDKGICLGTSDSPSLSGTHTHDGTGTGAFTTSLSGLNANTTYYIRAYATSVNGTSYGSELTFTTSEFTCGTSTVNVFHTADTIAPVAKTVAYGTVTNVPGETSKCWITSNLGATQQATAVNDATEASAGWYWQFNKKQGYKHDGSTRTPNTTWITPISESSDWLPANDPCVAELGSAWRLPTSVEWTNVDNSGSWTTSTSSWNSLLKIHSAGYIYTTGALLDRGVNGDYWSGTQNSVTDGYDLTALTYACSILNHPKSLGFSLRCIRNLSSPTVSTGATDPPTNSSVGTGGAVTSNGGSSVTARGVCWSTTTGPTIALTTKTVDGAGTGNFNSNISGLTPNTTYHYRAYATNSLGTAYGNEEVFTTSGLTCGGSTVTTYHTAGSVAPLAKTVVYGTINNIPGETTKCWITRNLGASQIPSGLSDPTEASAGWYWQFNRKQGYMHDGTTRTPNTTWITAINESSNWISANDPCTSELGSTWRLPTSAEWNNVVNSGGWTTSTSSWNSDLKIHSAGYLLNTSGSILSRGANGDYWSSSQFSASDANDLTSLSSGCSITNHNKAYGFTVRCIKTGSTTVTTSAVSAITNSSVGTGGLAVIDGSSAITSRGVCWSTNSGPTVSLSTKTADGSGTGTFTSNISGLSPNTTYYVRAYAINNLGTTYGNELSFKTTLFTCGTSVLTVYHLADTVAPVSKTVTYGTAMNIPGETAKCWITRNLGASQQPTTVSDTAEASAGWYWQFNRKQGYKYNGTTRTPNITWISTISEYSDWLPANDPCALELGTGWRIPTYVEWQNVSNNGSWTNWNGPFSSGLNLYAAGKLNNSTGNLEQRAVSGNYWSITNQSITNGNYLTFNSAAWYYLNSNKAYGYSVRCLNKFSIPTLTTTTPGPVNATYAISGGTITDDGGFIVTSRGVCWNTTPAPTIALSSKTIDGSGTGTFTSNFSGLDPETKYYIRAYATNCNGTAYGNEISFTTPSFNCGTSYVTVYHVADSVAPVTKAVTYGTVPNVPGVAYRCWITQNLGASQQATSVSDATEASAGWYWQFNRKQGYKHDGSTLSPAWTVTSISENTNWLANNDPCTLELGTLWRIPTNSEWYNADNIGGWTNWNGPWSSGLALHAAGFLDASTNGTLTGRGSSGIGMYWSSTQSSATDGNRLLFYGIYSSTTTLSKAYGMSLRCLRDDYPPTAANFNANTRYGVTPMEVLFTDQTTTFFQPLTWKWYFGDGDSSAVQNPVHIYHNDSSDVKAYTVTLRVSDAHNKVSTKTMVNYIKVCPQVYISGGNVSGTWHASNTYYIGGEIIVPYGDTLTIEPGTKVKFRTNTNDGDQMALPRTIPNMDYGFMTVYGTLIAQGTATDSIHFTRAGNTGWWGLIRMARIANAQNPFKYCKMDYASYLTSGTPARDLAGLTLDSNSTAVTNCRFINNYMGIRSDSSHSLIQYNKFSSNTTGILTASHSAPVIKQNIFTSNTGQGIKVTNSGVLKVASNTYVGNGYGVFTDGTGTITVDNSILWNNITGNLNSTLPTVKYSCIKGGYSGPDTGNIVRNPKFAGTGAHPYDLIWSNFPVKTDTALISPCINTGNPDLNGNGTYWQTDPADRDPDMSWPDMGACYFHQNPLISAYNVPPPGGDSSFYNFGTVEIPKKSPVHSFVVRNDADRLIDCPVVFTGSGANQFQLSNTLNSLLHLSPYEVKNGIQTFFQPTLVGQQDGFFRAGITGFYDSIWLQGTGLGTGTVTGYVKTSTGLGVGGVTITVSNLSSGTNYTGFTGSDGYYAVTNVGYGSFSVTPSKTEAGSTHTFNPVSASVTLLTTTPVNQDFTDVSNFNIEGYVTFNGTTCPSNGVSIFLDDALKATTASNGYYKITEVKSGVHTIKPDPSSGHTFTPAYIIDTVLSMQAGKNFTDNFTHNLHGHIWGGCGVPLADSVKVKIECKSPCNPQIITIYTDTTGYFSINLPPFQYDVTAGPVSYHGNMITFPIKVADIRSRDTVQNFVHHSDPVVEITGFEPYTDSERWTIIEQFKPYTIGINVFEPYITPGGNTVKCRVDTGNILILDDLSDKGLDTLALSDTTTYYSFRAGLANITGGEGEANPYQKLFQAQFIKNGTPSIAEKWVYVVGQRPRKTAFTTTTPEIPLLILRDPPGDNSYSFFSQTTEVSQAISLGIRRNSSTTVYEKLSLGLDFNFSTGWIFEVETEINVTLDFTAEMSMSMSQNSVKENQLTFITNNMFATSGDETSIGQPGDLYVGGAMNILYGITDILTITNNVVNIKQDIIMAPKGFATKYIYTESHIVNQIIPSLYLIGDVVSAHRWESFIARNQLLKNEAQFVENRSISGLVEYTDSYTMTKTSTETQEFELVIDESVAIDAGITISGIGFAGGVKLATSYTSGKSTVNTTVNSTTTGYFLKDNDPGDAFTMDVKNDRVYGTPVFVTISGQSSCPYEPATVPREECSITPSVSSQSGVNPSGPAIFSVNLNNTSQTNEASDYQLRVLNSTNPHGASIMAGGQSLSSPLIYTLAAYSALPVTIYISMPPGGQVYDFTGIQIVLESVCDPSVGDTATFDVHFIPPCSPVSIFSPGDNWVVNQASNHILPVTITGYDTTNTQLQAVALEYSANNGNTWTEVTSIPRASIHASYLQYNWDVTGFDENKNYSIRAVAKCSGSAKNYSASLTGVIDTQSPELFGTPQPAQTLHVGDEISCIFNEPLNPTSVTINSCQLLDSETGEQVSARVQYGTGSNKIIFTINPGMNYYIENRFLTAQVTGVTDRYGNTLAGSINWTFRVDRGPLHWIPDTWQYIVSDSNTSFQFTSGLLNNSDILVQYSVLKPGSYISTSSGGNLPPAPGQINITFTTPPMDPGPPHYDTIYASTLGYPEEKIYVSFYTPGFVSFAVNPDTRYVTAAAGTTMFIVSSNLAWSGNEATNWLSTSPSVGYNTDTIFVNYDANTAFTPRTAVINIKAEGITPPLSLNVSIIQAGASSPLPVSVAINAEANPVCAGTPVTFTATPVNGGTTPQYQWKKGNVSIAGATNATYACAPANSDAITCMLTSSEVNTTGSPATSNTITMTVNPLLPVSVTITASTNNIDPGTLVTFTAIPVNGGAVPVYQWIVNGGVVSGATSNTYAYVPVNNDHVQCALSSNATCVTGNPASSNIITLIVNTLSVTLNVGNDTIASGQTLCYNAQQTITVAGNSTTFLVENQGIANFIAGQAIYFKPGTKVNPGGTLTGKIAPNGPWCTPEKITEVMADVPDLPEPGSKHSFIVYPNPTNGNFTIAHKGDQLQDGVKIEIYSMTGEKVATSQMTGQKHEVEFSKMNPGLYFIRIITSQGYESLKLVKTR